LAGFGYVLHQEIISGLCNKIVGTISEKLSCIVKGCQMPALHCVTVLLRQTVEGRRRTSLEGGNRGLRSDMFGWRAVYGDLNCGSAFLLANKSICGVMAGRSFRSMKSM
jgi:hypothetical protein